MTPETQISKEPTPAQIEARTKFIELDKKRAEYKEFLEEYKAAVADVHSTHGLNAFFQDADGIVYKTDLSLGRFVYYEPQVVMRTRRDGEVKGSLSLSEAREAGFTVEGK
jgi:hypothetical protein